MCTQCNDFEIYHSYVSKSLKCVSTLTLMSWAQNSYIPQGNTWIRTSIIDMHHIRTLVCNVDKHLLSQLMCIPWCILGFIKKRWFMHASKIIMNTCKHDTWPWMIRITIVKRRYPLCFLAKWSEKHVSRILLSTYYLGNWRKPKICVVFKN